MFRLIKYRLIALLSFSGALAIKCIILNNQPCMTRPTLINLNPNKHNERLVSYELWLVQIDVMEVVTLLIVYQVEFMFQIKQKM